MSEKVKNYLGIAGVVALGAFALSAVAFVSTYSRSIEPSSFRSFSVSGEGEVVAIPDVAEFTFSVITQGGKDIPALQKENANTANAIIDFLKENGVDKKDIKTRLYSVEPRYQYYDCNNIRPVYNGVSTYPEPVPCPPPEIVGYNINQSVLVKVRDFDKAGELLAGTTLRGANQVSGLSFTIDDPDALQTQARTDAIAKAQEKANATAKAGGFRVGRLLSIDEGYTPYYDYGLKTTAEYGIGGDASVAPSPSIEPGSQEVKVTVVMRFEIR
ncbi:MAG: SIMPL domain-containing protein [Patescibacteria group bacterium]|nr:SIMPL domain-containing protein [Patescibacteria group bacterium]